MATGAEAPEQGAAERSQDGEIIGFRVTDSCSNCPEGPGDPQGDANFGGPSGSATVPKMKRLLVLALLVAAPVAAQDEADRWNLADIFPTPDAWKEAKDRVAARFDSISSCQSDLTSTAARLEECLDLIYDIQKEAVRVYSYAAMMSDQDTREAVPAKMRSEAQLMFAEYSKATSFLPPAIIEAGKPRIDRFLKENPGLAEYDHALDDILREAPHTRSEEVEQVIAQLEPLAGSPSDVRRTLANADLPWKTIEVEGESLRLDPAGYTRGRQHSDRAVRKQVFDVYWSSYSEYERTFGVALAAEAQKNRLYADLRRYPSSLASALSGDAIPESVYRTLVRITNENLSTLHRYFKLRGRILGIDDLAYYDIYPSLIESSPEYAKEEGVELALAAGRILGDEYVEVMKRGFEERWIDWFPREGKRSGAYMNGSVYDVHPYLLLNYDGAYDSVSTLAHEYGHAVHSFLANREQPYPKADYATFVAEVASQANENLLLDHMLKNAKTDEERLFFLGHELEGIRGAFFRQTMFAEFELEMHDRADAGEALTGESFTEIYGDLLRRYHGHDEGVMTIDDAYAVEWAAIPHFYLNFYVYQYATSLAAAAQLSDAILSGKPGAEQAYLDLLRAGGSDYPIDLLKKAGIDMTTPAPYEALIARAERVMDQIEEILARR